MNADARRRFWIGPVLAVTSLLVVLFSLEVGLRVVLDEEREQRLPRFGVPESVQARIAWSEWQSRRDKYGTTSYPSSFDEPDRNLGWRIRPNVDVTHVKPGIYEVSVHTNNRGMRGLHDVASEKRHGAARVGVFGCSQTFGETVNDEETYVERLGERLENVEFLNFGVRGYGTDQMLLYYEQDARTYELDVVVLAFAFYHMKRNDSGFLFYAKPYFTLSDSGALALSGVPVPSPEELAAEDLEQYTWPLADRSVLLRWTWQRSRNLRGRDLYSPDGDAWMLTRALISRFTESASASGAHVVVMNIDESHRELEDELAALTDELGAGLVNLGPALREAAENGISYTLPADNHWNAEGHRLVADWLQAYLCSHALTRACDRPDPPVSASLSRGNA
ncbi:MAG: SGNH/GDSL hydrolase family protein [Myxococcales bacterium]|nr:MAG: SGNH/GDSL hydrolase family protein [Myxococcales bacterium]